jgi:hypothetical protein
MVGCEDVDGEGGRVGWHRLRIVCTIMAGFGVDGIGL